MPIKPDAKIFFTLHNQILIRLSAAPLAEDQLIRDLKNLPPISHRPSLNWSFLAVWGVTPAGFWRVSTTTKFVFLFNLH